MHQGLLQDPHFVFKPMLSGGGGWKDPRPLAMFLLHTSGRVDWRLVIGLAKIFSSISSPHKPLLL